MTLYQKIIAVFGMLRTSIDRRAEKSELAPDFSDSSSYAVGRLVFRNGSLYRCTVGHSGAWDASHFTGTTIDEALSLKSEGGGGGGGIPENLYARDESTGLYHKITIGSSGGAKTVAVEQNGVSGVSSENAYAKDESTGLYHKLTVVDSGGVKTLAVEQNGEAR